MRKVLSFMVVTLDGFVEGPNQELGARAVRIIGSRYSRYCAPLTRRARPASRAQNYVGFPNGISGEELASRAAIQAQRLGAGLNAPCEVAGLRVDDGFQVIVLADGSDFPSRTVIIASGARYQRLAVDDLERFERRRRVLRGHRSRSPDL